MVLTDDDVPLAWRIALMAAGRGYYRTSKEALGTVWLGMVRAAAAYNPSAGPFENFATRKVLYFCFDEFRARTGRRLVDPTLGRLKNGDVRQAWRATGTRPFFEDDLEPNVISIEDRIHARSELRRIAARLKKAHPVVSDVILRGETLKRAAAKHDYTEAWASLEVKKFRTRLRRAA